MRILRALFATLVLTYSCWLHAANNEAIRLLAENFLRMQSKGLPGEVSVSVSAPGPGSSLPDCERLEAFMPAGSRSWGKTNVGVRCLAPHTWSLLLAAQGRVIGNYVVTARPLPAGQILLPGDLAFQKGDLSLLPNSIVTTHEQALGKTLRNPLSGGQPLRQDQLVSPLVIRQGQNVTVISQGEGFSVSSEGKAMNNASSGQVVQLRMPSGQVISAIAQSDGSAAIAR